MHSKAFTEISRAQLIKLQKQYRTDTAIGEVLGLSQSAIFTWRKGWNIPPLEKEEWKPEISKTQLLKLQKRFRIDAAIGEALGVSKSSVYRWREKLGIPYIERGGKKSKLSKIPKDRLIKLQEKFGSDPAIAEALGVCPGTVYNWRKKHGIPAIDMSIPVPTKAQLVKLQKELGSDSAIAEEFGVSLGLVHKWRKERGVPAFEHRRGNSKISITSKTELVKLQKEYGTDSAIAEALGVHTITILRWRQKWGIPAIAQHSPTYRRDGKRQRRVKRR